MSSTSCGRPESAFRPTGQRAGGIGAAGIVVAGIGVAVVIVAALAGMAQAAAQVFKTEKVRISVETVARGLVKPWGFDFLPDGRIIVTEKGGRLRIVGPDGALSKPIANIPRVDPRGQGGLLDVALHPDFADNRLVYLSYAEPGRDGTNSTAAARGKLSADGARLEDLHVIFSQKPKLASTLHYGSRIVFDRKGHVFITTGERSFRQYRGQSQQLTSHLGKVIRLNADGSVPADNPFRTQKDALPEIWSYGHRNIQGAAIHPETGKLWTIEHGPAGGDELNIPKPGANYGWPVVSHGVNYDGTPVGTGRKSAPGMEPPLATWSPVIAPGGMVFYSGRAFPAWRGNLLISGLRSRALIRLELDGEKVVHEERLLRDIGARIRDVAIGPGGHVYVITDAGDGRILKLSPAK